MPDVGAILKIPSPSDGFLRAVDPGQLTPAKIEKAEAKLLQLPQVDCPVVHRFGPGVYIRELTVKAGTFFIGHHHRFPHMNVMLKGRASALQPDGTIAEYRAPMTMLARPGRKIMFVHEDMIWDNVYATQETSVDKIEERLFLKTDSWLDNHAALTEFAKFRFQPDRDDFARAVVDIGFTPEGLRELTERADDQTTFPVGDYKVVVSDSPIEGRGLFATGVIASGEIIAPARIGGKRTPAGRFTNHALSPNAKMVARENGDIDLVAIRDIKGCMGGQPGDEITVCYRAARAAANQKELCQQ